MNISRFSTVLALSIECGIAFAIGCGEQSRTGDQAIESTTGAQPLAVNPAETEPNVNVKLASWAEIQTAVAEHRGKPVVLDLWTSW